MEKDNAIKSSGLLQVPALGGVVVVHLAVLELRIPAEFYQVLSDAVSVLVLEGLYAVEPEHDVDQRDQEEGLEEGAGLTALVVRELVVVFGGDEEEGHDDLHCH